MSSTLRADAGGAVHFEVETRMPTRRGRLRVRAYRDSVTGADHLAIVADPLGPMPLVLPL